ncbi:carboxypeptidase regulatory-like domain-containing protein [Wenyingzhuangia sp. 2_MG-2023]|uniref:TonB-dependent receptor n=1 Tax=Wenyingzhuangia sp. 2_MG-2023 TaxID=3062639 RepID=UPI0026E23CBC|nr:carboxypeptidase regulatory-like domain-containing protein [Wenyingzhuangia sp. 2_MG-2023]MDO6739117.1 carboxypeptidase regulatory-like domain-containing protein [Wenyingzhuangia sp. 2_MG-2023]
MKTIKIVTILFVILFSSTNVFSQSTNASIKGTFTDNKGEPLPGVTVLVQNTATGFKTGVSSNMEGDFILQQLPLGGPYVFKASYIGFSSVTRHDLILNQNDEVILKIVMEESLNNLETVVLKSSGISKRIKQIGSSTKISSQQIENLPSEGRNFTRLTSLSPLQGGGSMNLGGQRRTSTNITIDGANARNTLTAGEVGGGPFTISQEAVREFEVSTNDYSVTQGRQGGGALNVVTKSGTNEFHGSAFSYYRADALQSKYNIRGQDRNADFYTLQTGFSVGGPIIKDKLHFFATYERQDAGSPVTIADIQSEEDENLLGISKDNLDRFLDIARTKYGVSNAQQVGQFDRKTTANNLFVRLDWQINDKHRLTLRNLFNKYNSPMNSSDNSDYEIAESWSDFESQENSILLSLRSKLSSEVTNEFKLQYQHAERAYQPSPLLPSANIPRAIVEVSSVLPNGNTRSRDIQIGGQRYSPETNLENQFHITNTTYVNLDNVNFTFGTDNTITHLETLLSNEQNGRFFFDSLDDFENLNASRYAREVPLEGTPPLVKQNVYDLSLFAEADFNIHEDVNVVAGLRWDATIFSEAGKFNPVVYEELGIRTDNKPSDLNNIQPRLQFTWNIKGQDKDILRVGGGMFSSQPHYYAQVNNVQNSGMLLGAIDVTGDKVPTPEFDKYRKDVTTVPGVPAGETPFSTINAVSDDFEVPTVFKGNISYTHFFDNGIYVGVNALLSHTKDYYTYQEANLVDEPYFTTADGRKVFVPANTIGANGQVDWTASRKSDKVGRALLLTSDGILDQSALVVNAGSKLGKDGYVNASVTFNKTKDNSSYNCCVANTSTFLPVEGDPRDLNYGYSDNHFDTKVIVNGATPTWKGFKLGLTAIGSGGSRYSLMVDDNTSANGDYNLRNDIAYIYDPNDANTPAEIANAYNEILNDPETSESFKDYLRSSFGGYAKRNGGKNPFYFTLDMRLTKDVKLFKSHKLEFSADVFNVANLLNKDWGVNHNLGNRDFMRVNGFDPTTKSYSYEVQTGAGTEPIGGTPWRLQLGARYSF